MNDEELKEYLMKDIAIQKFRINEMKRTISLICVACFLVTLVGGGLVYLVTKEHTKQLSILLEAGISKEVTTEHVYQTSSGDSTAILNNKSDGNTITNN